jgi:hypothetical protein
MERVAPEERQYSRSGCSRNMAVRKIRPNYRSITGLVADERSARSIAYQSSLEREFIKHLIFNKNVLGYEEQPLTIEFTEPLVSSRDTHLTCSSRIEKT